MTKKLIKSERLLRDLFVASKNLGSAENCWRKYPSEKSFADYSKAEQKLLLAEQLVEEYLTDSEIEFKLKSFGDSDSN